MDDPLLKHADTILAENRAMRAHIREELVRARIEVARIRAIVMLARAERNRSQIIRSAMTHEQE